MEKYWIEVKYQHFEDLEFNKSHASGVVFDAIENLISLGRYGGGAFNTRYKFFRLNADGTKTLVGETDGWGKSKIFH